MSIRCATGCQPCQPGTVNVRTLVSGVYITSIDSVAGTVPISKHQGATITFVNPISFNLSITYADPRVGACCIIQGILKNKKNFLMHKAVIHIYHTITSIKIKISDIFNSTFQSYILSYDYKIHVVSNSYYLEIMPEPVIFSWIPWLIQSSIFCTTLRNSTFVCLLLRFIWDEKTAASYWPITYGTRARSFRAYVEKMWIRKTKIIRIQLAVFPSIKLPDRYRKWY